ncbi:putative thiamine transport system ATP-binding protein [Mesorhizobium soli]|jgi:putative thiamine transport system ATP-binding protein|uniref:ATP-binding cassette domain-containing protein n=1 Tax=Pseudaminobacter soli (ex Li et al. 2025) TaxID=1295366 RepID=UPI002474533D|nr:ATP-binding cassette domain-containing protein [Mesorhizobium soli]MDH6231245.1 putative thiamine transport system ATP-binding protein [Mesorhizobium soli]
MAENGLFLDDVTIALNGHRLVSVTHSVAPGKVLTVMGPSGSGKSSLLAYIGGFLPPAFQASGRVFSGDIELTALPAEDRHAGILFQDPLLFPHMSVGGNLVFAIPETVKGKAARTALAEAALEGVGLGGMAARDPDTLSGGQKARVALARALLSSPRMLLLDEPFSKLDANLRGQIRELVFSKARAGGLPVLLVTHDEADAEAAGGAVIRIGTE